LNVLVTGASGFIGKHMFSSLDERKCNIFALTRDKNKLVDKVSNHVTIVEGDLNNLSSLKLAFTNIDVVLNLAAEVRNTAKLEETNVNGVKNLVNAALECGVKRIIHLSSVGVVGMQFSHKSTIVDENARCFPKNEYERTKLLSEKILIEALKNQSIELQIIRPTNVYGESHPQHALLNLVKHVQARKPMLCARYAQYNYVYVKDVTNAINHLLVHNPDGMIFNVGSSTGVKQFTKQIADSLNKQAKIMILPNLFFRILNSVGIKKLNPVANHVQYSDEKIKQLFVYDYDNKKAIMATIIFFKSKDLIS
jgi:nucleoside-diphosphate-sugar epimerase